MKIDQYKDLESKFFVGDKLTSDEELFLKNENKHPYFSFVKEEKQEQLDTSFDDFLKKIEEPKVIPVIAKRNYYPKFWVAASVVFLMGISGFWMYNDPNNSNIILAKKTNISVKSKGSIVQNLEIINDKLSLADLSLDRKEGHNNNFISENKLVKKAVKKEFDKLMAQSKNENSEMNTQSNDLNELDLAYRADFLIINGKPVYDENEAIEFTENAFNYFANNVSQTINQAESIQNQIDVSNLLKF